MDIILKSINNKDNFELGKSSPNFNQNFDDYNFTQPQTNTMSTAVNEREENKDILIENHSFGESDFIENQSVPVEM